MMIAIGSKCYGWFGARITKKTSRTLTEETFKINGKRDPTTTHKTLARIEWIERTAPRVQPA